MNDAARLPARLRGDPEKGSHDSGEMERVRGSIDSMLDIVPFDEPDPELDAILREYLDGNA